VRHRAELDAIDSKKRMDDAMSRAVEFAGIPPRFRTYETGGLYERFGVTSLYIHGEQGRGKTTRACGLLMHYLRDHMQVTDDGRSYRVNGSARFVSATDMFMRLRATYDERGETEAKVMASFVKPNVLCLDDIGKGQMSKWEVMSLHTILDDRYRDQRKVTIITSQYDGRRLTDMLASGSDVETAKAVWSRISGMCKVGHVGGEDLRVTGKTDKTMLYNMGNTTDWRMYGRHAQPMDGAGERDNPKLVPDDGTARDGGGA
jgi:DNA replication protein DnaC